MGMIMGVVTNIPTKFLDHSNHLIYDRLLDK